jgi:hypothetical protein
MAFPITRRTWLGHLSVALLTWAGLRPATAASTPPGCPHPVHQPLCADRPGEGWWYRTRLRLACPLCGETVRHDGYLPDTAYAFSRAVPPPGFVAPCDSRSCVATYTFDGTGLLASGPSGQSPGHG